MFNFYEMQEAMRQIDVFNENYIGKYKMSCASTSKGLHITVIDYILRQVYTWQPFESVDELHEFIVETCW